MQSVEHGLAKLVTSTQDAEMAKAIEKIHNSTFRQTANGLAEKAIKVRETDRLDTSGPWRFVSVAPF